MKVIVKCGCPISLYETFKIVLADFEEKEREIEAQIHTASSLVESEVLNPQEKKRQLLSRQVLEYIERHSIMPPLPPSKTLEINEIGLNPNAKIVSQTSLENVMNTLFNKYKLTQQELNQIIDFPPNQLVHLYALLANDSDDNRFSEEDMQTIFQLIQDSISRQHATLEDFEDIVAEPENDNLESSGIEDIDDQYKEDYVELRETAIINEQNRVKVNKTALDYLDYLVRTGDLSDTPEDSLSATSDTQLMSVLE